MTIELRARAPLNKAHFPTAGMIVNLAAAVAAAAKGTPLEPITSSYQVAEEHFVAFHPGRAPVCIFPEGEDLAIAVSTALIGPGYHAFVVSALESAGAALGLHWQWNDPTNYVHERDFDKLQSFMAQALKALVTEVRAELGSDEAVAGVGIFMDPSFKIKADGKEVLTPLGPVGVDRFLGWQSLDVDALKLEAAHFVFAWWDEAFDPWFYRGLAIYSMWNDLRWAYPIDPQEVELAKRTLRWAKEALQTGVVSEEFLPKVIGEITDVIFAKAGKLHFPNAEGIGYRRRQMALSLDSNWILTIPASLGRRFEEENGRTLLVIENHVLHIRVDLGIAKAWENLEPDAIEIRRRVIDAKPDLKVLHAVARRPIAGGRIAICQMSVTAHDRRIDGLVDEIIGSIEFEED